MDSKELRDLMEAYSEVYAPEQLDELSDKKVAKTLKARERRFDRSVDSGAPNKEFHQLRRTERLVASRNKRTGSNIPVDEEFDIFDVVLEFLQVEGYAETLEEAEWMMANMIDEEAIDIIVEASCEDDDEKEMKKGKKSKKEEEEDDDEDEEELDEAIYSEKGKAKAAEMIAKRSTPSGRAKSGKGANVAQIRQIRGSGRGDFDREGLGGTPMTPTMAKNPIKKQNYTGTGNKAARRAGLTPTREKPNAWKEDYVNEAQHARENPEKYEREQAKKSAPVRGERTTMPPRGDKRREDFEKWYAKQMGR